MRQFTAQIPKLSIFFKNVFYQLLFIMRPRKCAWNCCAFTINETYRAFGNILEGLILNLLSIHNGGWIIEKVNTKVPGGNTVRNLPNSNVHKNIQSYMFYKRKTTFKTTSDCLEAMLFYVF
jgi:hypothetical protein